MSGPARDRRTPVVAVLLVVLTVAGLYVAGTARRPTGLRITPSHQVASGQRTLSCSGGIDGARQLTGTPGAPQSAVVSDPPQPITVEGSDVATAFAEQVARSSRWLAFGACPEPRASWWFVGLGGSSIHDSRLTLANPRAGGAVVDVDVFGPHGPVDAPGLHGLAIASGSSRTLDLAKVAASAGDLAVRVTASRGLVAASASEVQAPDFVTKAVHEWVPAQPGPRNILTLTGLPATVSAATLLVANPGQDEAVVKVEAVGSTGTFVPQGVETMTVSPGSVGQLKVARVFNGKPVAIRLSSPTPVVASVRAVAAKDEVYAAASAPLLGAAAVAVPAGVDAIIRLSSTGSAGSVRITSYDGQGKQIDERTVAVPAGTSVDQRLSGKTRSVVLDAASPHAVAALVVSTSSGVGSVVVAPVQLDRRRPGVVAGE